jgi:hypothetical protein
MLRRVAFARTDVSEEHGNVPPKRRFLQEAHGVTSQKTPYFKKIIGRRIRLFSYHAKVTICITLQLRTMFVYLALSSCVL